MKYQNSSERFQTLVKVALQLAEATRGDALVLLAEGPLDWDRLKDQVGDVRTVVAVETAEQREEAIKAEFPVLLLGAPEAPVQERLSQALLQSVADEVLQAGARVVTLYSGFEPDVIDSVSVVNLGEHLERLTARDLRELDTKVPLETLKTVVDLALEIGREGREGKPVGTLFVVGDHTNTLKNSRPLGLDPFKGYLSAERNLRDRRLREDIKEIAQLDGAMIVRADGTIIASRRYLGVPASKGTRMPKGLGTRHHAAAAITAMTNAVAVAVSQSSGTVRIFQNGELILRIEPFRRPMKFREFDSDGHVND